MFNRRDSLHHTAEGRDGIPAWFLCLAAPVLARPLAHLVNLSLNAYRNNQTRTETIKDSSNKTSAKCTTAKSAGRL